MDKIAEFVVSLFRDLKLPYRWGAIAVILTLVLLGVWGFENVTGQFYFSRLEKKITLLRELKELRDSGIVQDPELNQIYQDMVNDLESFSVDRPVTMSTGTINLSDPVTIGKAISGGFLWLLVFIVGIPGEIKKNKRLTGMTFFIGIFILVIALLFSWIGMSIPTILNPWVNYIGFPILQIFILIYLSRKGAQTNVVTKQQ